MEAGQRPLLIVVSAPSGAGKSTLCDRLLGEYNDIVYSVSCTTRPLRGEEEDGVDYFFLTEDEFHEKVDSGKFLEYAEVHGCMYGTLRDTVTEALGAPCSVIMDIDIQGAAQIREYIVNADDEDPLKRAFVDIFVLPPSIEALRDRLETRNEDDAEVIDCRMRNAEIEMADASTYMYRIVNDDVEIAYREFRDIVLGERSRHE